MNPPKILMDEIYTQLQEIETRQDNLNGFSIREMSDHLGKSAGWCRNTMRKLISTGEYKFEGKRKESMIDGRTYTAPIYVKVKK